MTREEAIEVLTRIHKCVYVGDELFEAEKEQAIDMAIEALKREDTMLKEIERVVLCGERGEVNE